MASGTNAPQMVSRPNPFHLPGRDGPLRSAGIGGMVSVRLVVARSRQPHTAPCLGEGRIRNTRLPDFTSITARLGGVTIICALDSSRSSTTPQRSDQQPDAAGHQRDTFGGLRRRAPVRCGAARSQQSRRRPREGDPYKAINLRLTPARCDSAWKFSRNHHMPTGIHPRVLPLRGGGP